MVQREVARRLLAKVNDDDWGALSVFTQAACSVRKVVEASPGCFHPPPRVHSTVVALTPHVVPRAAETAALQRVVHALFAARRKTLRNGLSSLLERSLAEQACATAGIDPGLRPETLTIEQLGALSEACAALAPHIGRTKPAMTARRLALALAFVTGCRDGCRAPSPAAGVDAGGPRPVRWTLESRRARRGSTCRTRRRGTGWCATTLARRW